MIGKEQVVTKRPPYRLFRMDVAKAKAEKILARIFFRWGVFVVLIGFLLGRAVIIGELTPFAVPFIAVLYHLRRDKLLLAGAAVIAGAVSHQFGAPLSLALGMVFFIFVQKLLERWDKGGLRYAPFAVFLAVFLSNLLLAFNTSWSGYALTMAGIEASLSLVLTLIFIQVMPLVTSKKRRKTLKNEELVCLAILLASMLTGTVGWMMLGLSLEHVLSRYAILVFALAAGGAIGATVGVVLCIVLSLANVGALLEMSLLSF
jgi:stage II sporulation protein E